MNENKQSKQGDFLTLFIYWTLVGIPFFWGLVQSLSKSIAFFK